MPIERFLITDTPLTHTLILRVAEACGGAEFALSLDDRSTALLGDDGSWILSILPGDPLEGGTARSWSEVALSLETASDTHLLSQIATITNGTWTDIEELA